mgnify:FL=1
MRNQRYLKITVIILLVSNLFLLGFLFFNRPPEKGGPRNLIIQRLHFSPEQIKKYDALISDHRSKISQNREDVIRLRTELYNNLNNKKPADHDLIDKIAEKEKSAEIINYHHFEDIRKICYPDQQKDFDNLVFDLAKLFPKSQTRR